MGRLVSALPRESATARSVHGESATWGTTEHLLAAAVDALQAANWQRAGAKQSKRPQPIPRPGKSNGKRRSTLTDIEKQRRLLEMEARTRR